MAVRQKIIDFFLEAGREGYGSGVETIGIPHMNHKGIPYKSNDGRLYLIDAYCVNNVTHCSVGTTTIFEDGHPVWWMSYHGYYAPGTTKYLKQALLAAYNAGMFVGGRGPEAMRLEDGYRYKNFLDDVPFDPANFSGYEELLDLDGHQVGHHYYNGFSLE